MFLEDTIKSVISQNIEDLEYIVIDGGSKDNSVEIIKKYDKYIKYWISEKDKGQADAINKGMKIATGDIVAFINSDDFYTAGALPFIMDKFKQDADLDFVYGDVEFIDEHGNTLFYHKEINFDYLMGCFFGFGPIIPQPSSFWRRKIFDEIGFLDPRFKYNLDGEFFSRAVKNRKVKHFPVVFSKARLHQNTKTGSNIVKPTLRHRGEHLLEVYNSYENLFISGIVPFSVSKPLRWAYRSKRILTRLFHGHYFNKYKYLPYNI